METNNRIFNVLMMGFYGNRILVDADDEMMIGELFGEQIIGKEISKGVPSVTYKPCVLSIIHFKEDENIVIVYNKDIENKYIKDCIKNDRDLTPLVSIPSDDVRIFSRCAICRMDGDKFNDISFADIRKIKKYLAE